ENDEIFFILFYPHSSSFLVILTVAMTRKADIEGETRHRASRLSVVFLYEQKGNIGTGRPSFKGAYRLWRGYALARRSPKRTRAAGRPLPCGAKTWRCRKYPVRARPCSISPGAGSASARRKRGRASSLSRQASPAESETARPLLGETNARLSLVPVAAQRARSRPKPS